MSSAALVSSEFLVLCQGQVSLLVQGVGAGFAVVYLTEEWLGGQTTNLVPIAAYPENASDVLRGLPLQLPSPLNSPVDASAGAVVDAVVPPAFVAQLPLEARQTGRPDRSVPERLLPKYSLRGGALNSGDAWNAKDTTTPGDAAQRSPFRDVADQVADQDAGPWGDRALSGFAPPNVAPGFHQAVQPLYHDNRPVGMLLMARKGGHWSDEDYGQLERVAYTLSAACNMEHRLQWLQKRFQQQEVLQERQQDLLDNLLHQLRNPLTALRTFGKLLVRRLGPEDQNQRVAEGIVRESDRLQYLLTQMEGAVDQYSLLPAVHSEAEEMEIIEGDWEARTDPLAVDAATLETTNPSATRGGSGTTAQLPAGLPTSPLTGEPIALEACDPVAILMPLLDSFGAIAQEQGQSIQLQILPPFAASPQVLPFPTPEQLRPLVEHFPQVQSNPQSLQEVLSNLIDNGLKYGHPQGCVAITLAQEKPQYLSLCVSDDGPGIPAADRPRLFERHFRGVQAEGAKSGSGLGLAIARSLVEQMGGSLNVLSPATLWQPLEQMTRASLPKSPDDRSHPGPGSAFLLHLPWTEIRPV